MARRKGKGESGPDGPGEWIVTFSDCMTLLLCFFVLLLTFSSFDEVALQKLAGIFDYKSHDSIFPLQREVRDSYRHPTLNPVDLNDIGSDMVTPPKDTLSRDPKRLPIILNTDAYRDRKTFLIPSARIFWAKGAAFRPEGRRYLRRIAAFMRVLPCKVIVGETAPSGDEAEAGRLDRAWTLMRFFAAETRLPADRFSLTASRTPVPPRYRDQRMIAVTLLPKGVY
jgi:hypothetical protein